MFYEKAVHTACGVRVGGRTLTEEHVPDSEDAGPGQVAAVHTHEPLRHVQDGLHSVLLLQHALTHSRYNCVSMA